MRLNDKGFGLGLLALVITILIIGIMYAQVMKLYMGKSSRPQEQVQNTFADVNVSAPAATEDYDGVLASIKSRLNVSNQKELDRAKSFGAQ